MDGCVGGDLYIANLTSKEGCESELAVLYGFDPVRETYVSSLDLLGPCRVSLCRSAFWDLDLGDPWFDQLFVVPGSRR